MLALGKLKVVKLAFSRWSRPVCHLQLIPSKFEVKVAKKSHVGSPASDVIYSKDRPNQPNFRVTWPRLLKMLALSKLKVVKLAFSRWIRPICALSEHSNNSRGPKLAKSHFLGSVYRVYTLKIGQISQILGWSGPDYCKCLLWAN